MSGSGHLSRRRPIRLSADAAAEAEREAVVQYLNDKAAEVVRLAGRGAMDRDGADLLAHRLTAIADSIDAGLHLA